MRFPVERHHRGEGGMKKQRIKTKQARGVNRNRLDASRTTRKRTVQSLQKDKQSNDCDFSAQIQTMSSAPCTADVLAPSSPSSSATPKTFAMAGRSGRRPRICSSLKRKVANEPKKAAKISAPCPDRPTTRNCCANSTSTANKDEEKNIIMRGSRLTTASRHTITVCARK